MKTARPDLAPLVVSTLRRYRRGAIDERAATREMSMFKALGNVPQEERTEADFNLLTLEEKKTMLAITVKASGGKQGSADELRAPRVSSRDVAVLIGSTVRRYRRGEIGERTARIEAALVKALGDELQGDPKGKEVKPDLSLLTDEELKTAAAILSKAHGIDAGERT